MCAFTLIGLHQGEDGSRFWLVTLVLLSTSLPAFYEEFDGGGKLSHQLGPLSSAMSVIELEVNCLGIKGSEVKSLTIYLGPRISGHLHY